MVSYWPGDRGGGAPSFGSGALRPPTRTNAVPTPPCSSLTETAFHRQLPVESHRSPGDDTASGPLHSRHVYVPGPGVAASVALRLWKFAWRRRHWYCPAASRARRISSKSFVSSAGHRATASDQRRETRRCSAQRRLLRTPLHQPPRRLQLLPKSAQRIRLLLQARARRS